MADDLDKLNRLRVNAGKTELKSWKGSKKVLIEQIQKLEAEGHKDVLPGANIDAAPVTNDPELAAARPPENEPPSLADSGMAKNIDNSPKDEDKPKAKVTNGKPHLARGLDSEPYARQSREKVRDHRDREKKAAKAETKKDKPPKGAVDPKKDPEKAKRQQQHIEEKRQKRAAEGKLKPTKEKNDNEVSVADIARKLDIDPKVARAKLRRHEDKLDKLRGKGMDRWVFPKSAAAEIEKILRGGK